MVPCITIQRFDKGVYGWTMPGIDPDIGYPSVLACFSAVPLFDNLVEIRYRGIHMGTFTPPELSAENLSKTIDQIIKRYSELSRWAALGGQRQTVGAGDCIGR